ncbi:MAG: hypothetical protein P4M09_00560 [Devosia sp.]|nr:hypothetical protein [Devosia sp.]
MAVTPISVSPSLASVLNAAGDRSDVDFDYLLKTAVRESSLDPSAKAATSSATGLFQFLDSTWLRVMKSEGPRLGYQRYADAITQNADGEYVIRDSKLRAEVLKLREDPAIAADMAAAFTKSNGDYLKAKFGRMPSPGELYIAHFLGAQGAEKMFNAGLQNPDQIAAKLFPHEAAANKTIFYDHGQPRTIRQVYRALIAQHEGPDSLHPGYAVQQIVAQQQAAPVPLAPIRTLRQAATAAMTSTTATAPAPGAVARPTPAHGDYYVVEQPVAAASGTQSIGHSRPVTVNAADAPEIPSRIGSEPLSFTSLFSTDATGATASPVLLPAEEGQSLFFTQLYGQQ